MPRDGSHGTPHTAVPQMKALLRVNKNHLTNNADRRFLLIRTPITYRSLANNILITSTARRIVGNLQHVPRCRLQRYSHTDGSMVAGKILHTQSDFRPVEPVTSGCGTRIMCCTLRTGRLAAGASNIFAPMKFASEWYLATRSNDIWPPQALWTLTVTNLSAVTHRSPVRVEY